MQRNRIRRKKLLYIFFHINKCAGTTFRYHLEHNLKENEFVCIYEGRYFYVTEMSYKYFTPGKRREEIDSYFSRLTDEQKDTIKILYGHQVYYGIHRFFPGREARYITFVRHHAAREVSMYNFSRMILEDPSEHLAERDDIYRIHEFKKIRKNLTRGKKTFSFSEWLENDTEYANFISKILMRGGFAMPGETPENVLKKFYFVGITENYQNDALFLYYLLGVKKFYPDKNISKKYIGRANISKGEHDIISRRNTDDMQLYEEALHFNRNFKRHTPSFICLVLLMRLKMFLIHAKTYFSGYRTPLQVAYDASLALRGRIPLYARFVDTLKAGVSFLTGR